MRELRRVDDPHRLLPYMHVLWRDHGLRKESEVMDDMEDFEANIAATPGMPVALTEQGFWFWFVVGAGLAAIAHLWRRDAR